MEYPIPGMIPLLLLLFLLWMVYKLWTSAYSYWESRGYEAIPGQFPFGSSKDLSLLKAYQGTSLQKMYEAAAPAPFFGIYVMRDPQLVIRDPQVIRLVLTKEFQHFQNRKRFDRGLEEILAQNLFNLDGERWKTLRMKLTPTFTSGKLKAMFPLFVSCAETMDNMLLSRVESTLDAKDAASSFTSDTIFSCAFGLEVNTSPSLISKVKKIGNDTFRATLLDKINGALLHFVPEINYFYKPRFIRRSADDFFVNLVKETIEFRQKSGEKRNDFVDLLMELQNKGRIGDGLSDEGDKCAKSVEMTDEMMAAQSFVFFAAGFETSSSVQCYTIYELALHQNMQQKLQEEIDTKLQEHGGLTYQAIKEMTYLDMVISESMRKYPTLPILTRKCTRDFILPSGQKIEKGTGILIPVYALHHDPQYFPDPEEFNPERFSPKNKTSITPYTYLPFGEGPRICIGIRFGLLQTKMGLITLFRKYSVLPTRETQVPLSFIGTRVTTLTAGPIYVNLISRNR